MAVKTWSAVIPAFPARRTAIWRPPLSIVCAPMYWVIMVDVASSLPKSSPQTDTVPDTVRVISGGILAGLPPHGDFPVIEADPRGDRGDIIRSRFPPLLEDVSR